MPDLRGFMVVVTRPEHQAQALRAAIVAAGGKVILFPVLEITGPENPAHVHALLARIAEFNIAIFISPNAVEYGLCDIARVGGMPANLTLAAVGAGTGRALAAAGHPVQLVPANDFNSEALLALPAMQNVAGKKIIIFRGNGGREHLATTLRQRGARVEYAEVYRRTKPNVDPEPLIRAVTATPVSAVVTTSNEGLENFFEILGASHRQKFFDTKFLVASPRAAELARKLGVRQPPVVVSPMSDEAILNALAELAHDPT